MLNEVAFRFYDMCFLQQDFITSVYNVFERCHQIAFKTVCYRWYVCITGSLEEKRKIKLYYKTHTKVEKVGKKQFSG